MDQSTRDSLKSLDWALAQSVPLGKQDGEFTCVEFVEGARERDPSLSINGLRSRLQRMVTEGQLSSRKIALGGKQVNVYKRTP